MGSLSISLLLVRHSGERSRCETDGAVPVWDYYGSMPDLHIRNLPIELHEQLRARSAAEGRSMPAEAIVLLRQALASTSSQTAQRHSAIARLREIQQRTRLTAGAPSAEQLVREDRDAAG